MIATQNEKFNRTDVEDRNEYKNMTDISNKMKGFTEDSSREDLERERSYQKHQV
jgi:hypothetical protein